MWRGSESRHWREAQGAAAFGRPEAAEDDRPLALLVNILSSGGAQRRIATLANRFVELGRRVDLVSFESDGPMRAMVSPHVRIVPLRRSSAPSPLAILTDARTLGAYLDLALPWVLMSCVTDTHPVATLALRSARTDVPLVMRASRDPYRALPREKWLRRAIEPIKLWKAARHYRRANAIVALSAGGEAGLRRLIRPSSVPIETILNPIVERPWVGNPVRSEQDRGSTIPLILGVGRLVKQKDFATLLRAFARLRADRPARLVLLGEGPERQKLVVLAAHLGISADVELQGEVDDVAVWMSRANLLVSSSLWEGMQATLIEALAAGCPVVATDCPGGARDTLDNGRLGPLVPVGDASQMAAAMRCQLDDPPDPLDLAEGATRFGMAGKAELYLRLFDHLRHRRHD